MDASKYDFFEMLKKNKYDDLEDMVNSLELAKNEFMDILQLKYIPQSTTGYTLPFGIHEVRDIDFLVKTLLPSDVEVKISIDGIRIKTILTTNRRIKFTKRSFFITY